MQRQNTYAADGSTLSIAKHQIKSGEQESVEN